MNKKKIESEITKIEKALQVIRTELKEKQLIALTEQKLDKFVTIENLYLTKENDTEELEVLVDNEKTTLEVSKTLKNIIINYHNNDNILNNINKLKLLTNGELEVVEENDNDIICLKCNQTEERCLCMEEVVEEASIASSAAKTYEEIDKINDNLNYELDSILKNFTDKNVLQVNETLLLKNTSQIELTAEELLFAGTTYQKHLKPLIPQDEPDIEFFIKEDGLKKLIKAKAVLAHFIVNNEKTIKNIVKHNTQSTASVKVNKETLGKSKLEESF